MSLNDYFAANGAVYLRPVGLPDCYPLPGLPHGCKPPPPPLTMQHPCNPPQKPRTMAAVSPLHQVVPPQPSLPSYEASSLGFNATTRTSSFAAALRKLAKQAVDPVSGEKDLTQISPVSSPALNQGSLTPKRNVPNPPPPAMFLSNHQVSYASPSPPVVTIAPSRPVATHTSENRKVMDLSNVQQVNNAGAQSNGQIPDPLGVKMDSSKAGSRSAHAEKWDEPNKSMSGPSASSQVRPHATIAPLPRPDDSLTSSRGFQPYRGSEESRNTLPHHISLFEHHPSASSYPYSPAFLPPPHLSHPAYRFDDSLYLERYDLLRPPVMPYSRPGMMAPPTAFYPSSRYAADLIAQSLSLGSASNSILNHERLKQEEERRMREKELELDQSRTKEQERREKEQKEKEMREREHKEREHREKEKREREKSYKEKEEKANSSDHKKSLPSTSNHAVTSQRNESPIGRTSTAVSCTSSHSSSSTNVSNSTPLNLVMQPSAEPAKKETELWLPWQQPANHYGTQEASTNSTKQPTYRPQENHRHHQTKETTHTNEKVNLRFSPSILNEKKHSTATQPPETEPKKQTPEVKKFDALHHHITELSNKDHNHHEWRHEKLQKACTNNHRKSHESKKAKEDRNNSVYQNHQRKAVNGVVLKNTTTAPYQNEGMHARLLESEKCRMELSGQLQQQQQLQPKMHPIDRLPPFPPYKPNFHMPLVNKDNGLQKMYMDGYSNAVIKPVVDLTPVVSKLDLEAKKIQNNDFSFLDEEKEDTRLRNFLIITKGPPLKLDSNPQKLKFLKILGLTTHFKRKKIEFDMYLKRRKILLEDSEITPLEQEGEEELEKSITPPPVVENKASTDRLAERLRSEAGPEKIEFLLNFELTPITLVKKEEKERIRRIVQDERVRRHYRMLAKVNRKASPRRLFVPKSEAAQKLDHIRKMQERNLFANGMLVKHAMDEDDHMCDSTLPMPNHVYAPKLEQVPYSSSSGQNDHLRPSSATRDHPEPPHSPIHKYLNKYSFKRGHSLKNETRCSSLKPLAINNHVITNSSQSGACEPLTIENGLNCASVGVQVDSSLPTDCGSKSLKNAFNWPGLEAVMEAFYRHQNEQSSERTILSDRCHLLRQSQEDLKKEAESLSKKMADLLRQKRELDDERHQHQTAIDRIKQCLHFGR